MQLRNRVIQSYIKDKGRKKVMVFRYAMIIFSSLTAASLFGVQIVGITHAIKDTFMYRRNK